MINAGELIDNLVTLLRDIPELVAEMGGDEQRIYAYHDEYPQRSSVEDAIRDMPIPGIMVAYQGFGQSSLGGVTVWSHQVMLCLRVMGAYYSVLQLITKGVPTTVGMPIANATVHLSCDPMKRLSGNRQTDRQGLDYFEVALSFTEIGDD